jgi:hypothetical protein
VDWDRLADHLGGALAGTPDGAEVARLVATDPSWTRAADQLSVAVAAVAADLRAVPEPALPDDVAARLAAALRAAPPVGPAAAGTDPAFAAGPEPATRPAGQDPAAPPEPEFAPAGPRRTGAPAASRPTDPSHRPPGRPGTRSGRRRAVRWGAGVAAAAGVIAFAAIGIAALAPSTPLTIAGDDDSGGEAAAPDQSALVEQPADGADGPPVLASGAEYQPPTVAAARPDPPPRPVEGTPQLGPAGERDQIVQAPSELDPDQPIPAEVPPSLARLWADPAARAQCLDAVRAALQPGPVVIELVDFARFEGQEALVIWATTGDGRRAVWVSGAECGTTAAGPDGIFQNRE